MNLFKGATAFAIVLGSAFWVLGASAAAQTGETVRVTSATASIRAEPKANAAILTTVKAGTRLEVRAVEGDWFKIAMFMGAVRFEAYVSKRSVTLEKSAPVASPAPAARATSSGPGLVPTKFGMSAVVESGARTFGLTPTMARVVRIATRVDTARAAAAAMPIGPGGALPTAPAAAITYVWVIDRVADPRVMTDKRPAFVVRYDEAPGISPEDFSPAIVRLIGTPTGPQVMSALRGRVDAAGRTIGDWDVDRDLKQEVIRSSTELTARGVTKVIPEEELTPGDYAIVMRPTGNKKFAGAHVLSVSEDGRVFGIAWIFSVK